MTTKWCAECEEMVDAWQSHIITQEHHAVMTELGVCYGPFETSAPPVLEPDWQDHITDPSPAELAWMDEQAELLLLDL